MPRQGEGYTLGPSGIPGPGKVGPFPELVYQGIEKGQNRRSIREKGKQCKREKGAEGDGAGAAKTVRISS